VHVDIPGFIKAIKDKDFRKAINIIHQTDSLPCVTGRVCPQEEQCQALCMMHKLNAEPISIGRLERFAADLDLAERTGQQKKVSPAANRGRKVAIVGSGPAGLTCAAELAKKGYDVTVFEGIIVWAECWCTAYRSSGFPRTLSGRK